MLDEIVSKAMHKGKEGQYVSVCQLVNAFSPKTAHRNFLKLFMKLVCFKGKKLMEPGFWEKMSFWR